MPIRKIGVISRTYRHINRYREVIVILVKYGLGEVLAKLELQKHLDFGKGKSFILGKTAAEIVAISHWGGCEWRWRSLDPLLSNLARL